jgi:parallel beta-helix repeat protein
MGDMRTHDRPHRVARAKQSRRYRPWLEALESRQMLSGVPFRPVDQIAGLTSTAAVAATGRPVVIVQPGESIQAVVDAAQPGTAILLEPGMYLQTVTIVTPDLLLLGLRGPHGESAILQNPGAADTGITVLPGADQFGLANLTVQNFDANGVLLEGINGFVLSHVTAVNNTEYGLFPVFSTLGLIDGCTTSGHRDTGIYVGQSAFVLVAQNRSFDNVNGIEIENSSFIGVIDNDTHGNTAGILVDLLPGLDVTTSANIVVARNQVYDNNRPNNGDPGSLESFVPQGTGILILGADHVTAARNRVTGNGFVGIGVASTLLLGEIAGLPPSVFAGIDPNPDDTAVVFNYVRGNGFAPPLPGIPGADLLWDGSGTGNCWMGNVYDTSVPGQLPGCSMPAELSASPRLPMPFTNGSGISQSRDAKALAIEHFFATRTELTMVSAMMPDSRHPENMNTAWASVSLAGDAFSDDVGTY